MTPWMPIALTWDGQPVGDDMVAKVRWEVTAEALRVEVDAPFHDDPLPEAPAGSTDGLWGYEVVELFLLGPDERYLEIELGPAGHYLVLQLDGVRKPTAIGLPLTDYTVSVADGRWSGQAVMPRSYLAEPVQSFNAYRIHGVAGSGTGRHYLAHAAPGGSKPDFHRLDAFVAVPTPEASGP